MALEAASEAKRLSALSGYRSDVRSLSEELWQVGLNQGGENAVVQDGLRFWAAVDTTLPYILIQTLPLHAIFSRVNFFPLLNLRGMICI